jgi:gas vesicle protein
MRIHVGGIAFTDAVTSQGQSHRSQMATKQKKKFKDVDVESADKLLGVGHERFSSGAYSSFSKAVAQFDNSFSQLKEDSGDEEEDLVKEPNTKKGRSLGSGTGKASGGASGSGTSAGGNNLSTPKKQGSIGDAIDDVHMSAEKDLRRALQGFSEALISAGERSKQIPKAPHTTRLHAALDARLHAARLWNRGPRLWVRGLQI